MATSRLYAAEALERLVREIFQALGAPPIPAAESARHLLRSNLSGHDSHGVIRMAQYVAQSEAGEIAPSAAACRDARNRGHGIDRRAAKPRPVFHHVRYGLGDRPSAPAWDRRRRYPALRAYRAAR